MAQSLEAVRRGFLSLRAAKLFRQPYKRLATTAARCIEDPSSKQNWVRISVFLHCFSLKISVYVHPRFFPT
jgi:hypothetical protein